MTLSCPDMWINQLAAPTLCLFVAVRPLFFRRCVDISDFGMSFPVRCQPFNMLPTRGSSLLQIRYAFHTALNFRTVIRSCPQMTIDEVTPKNKKQNKQKKTLTLKMKHLYSILYLGRKILPIGILCLLLPCFICKVCYLTDKFFK